MAKRAQQKYKHKDRQPRPQQATNRVSKGTEGQNTSLAKTNEGMREEEEEKNATPINGPPGSSRKRQTDTCKNGRQPTKSYT